MTPLLLLLAFADPGTPAELAKLLSAPTDALSQGIRPGTSLREAAAILSVRCKVKIEIDTAAFQNAGAKDVDALTVGLDPVKGIPLELALQLLLDTLPGEATFK